MDVDHIMNNRLSLESARPTRAFRWRSPAHPARRCAGNGLERAAAAGEMFLRARQSAVCRREVPIARPARTGAPHRRAGQKRRYARYVTAWFIKAGEYVQQAATRIGFVATNSITQGEQSRNFGRSCSTATSWTSPLPTELLLGESDARGMAHVHVVIIGLAKRDDASREKRLFFLRRTQRRSTRKPTCGPFALSVRRSG